MEWLIIISLVLLGLALIIVEIIFIPGTTVVGIAGFIIAGFGVWQSFSSFGPETGWIVLGATSVFAIVSTIYSFKSGVWKKFSLKEAHINKFNDEIVHDLEVGDIGVAISVLRPVGNAEFKDKTYEVRTNGSYLEAGTKIRIIKLQYPTVTVEAVEQSKNELNSLIII